MPCLKHDAIEITGLGFTYPGAACRMPVIQDFSLTVTVGTHLAILGLSGCGKSTLLHLIAGLLPVQQGSIRVHGQPCQGPDTRRSLVFQNLALFPWLRARDNVAYGLRRQGCAGAEARDRAEQLLLHLGMSRELSMRFPCRLSQGQRQRVAIARALILNPQVLLLDEAAAALDAASAARLAALLQDLQKEQGFTCISVSHRLEEAVQWADRAILVDGPALRLLSDHALNQNNRLAVSDALRQQLLSLHHPQHGACSCAPSCCSASS